MNPVRRRKLLLWVFILAVLSTVTALVTYALRQNISLFYTPGQLVAGEAAGRQIIRLGGMVTKGSIRHSSTDLSVHFSLTDYNQTVMVNYRGILPDLFREEQGVVAKGQWINNAFNATEILAKHDANYMPVELKNSLKSAGVPKQ